MNEDIKKLLEDDLSTLVKLKTMATEIGLGKSRSYYRDEEQIEAMKAAALLSIAFDYKLKMVVENTTNE